MDVVNSNVKYESHHKEVTIILKSLMEHYSYEENIKVAKVYKAMRKIKAFKKKNYSKRGL